MATTTSQEHGRVAPPVQPVVRAQRLELVDEQGAIKITLDTQETGSVIRFWGKDRKVKAALGMLTTDRPTLLFLDGYLPRVDLRLEEDGQPSLSLAQNHYLDLCEVFIEAGKKQRRKEARQKAKQQRTKSHAAGKAAARKEA
jgi:hypothetical protein